MTERQKERASWIGLNAYGVFIACLVMLLGLRHFISWDDNDTRLLFNGGHAAYFISGLGLLYSYWKTRIDIEVYSSVLLVGGNIGILISNARVDGWDTWSLTVSLVLLITVIARVSLLLHGGVFVLPKWRE